jgi:hypothetical protein
MSNGIATWGVELSLFRTAVGKEFEIVRRLRRLQPTRDAVFFGAYGYFDLAAIRCLEDLSDPSLLPLDCDIVEASPFRFFGDIENHSKMDFLKALKRWKTAIAVFFKITPTVFLHSPNRIRWQAARFLRDNFPGSHVFFGLGFSEIFLLVGGNNLPQLLNRVTNFRIDPQKQHAITRQLRIADADTFFLKTASFPFVSHEKIHKKCQYNQLRGKIYPVVTLSCDPASERRIIRMLPPGLEVRNSYGDTDLICYWKRQKVPFAEFAATLTKIRDLGGPVNGFRKTTSYLETQSPVQPPQYQSPFRPVNKVISRKPLSDIETMGSHLIEKMISRLVSRIEPPSLRASITDLCLRMFSCLSDPHLESAYLDMENTIPYLLSLFSAASERGVPTARKREARFELSFLCDLARIAINQRYAGIETHPETLAHSQSPVLSDIRSLISAASSLPHFIFTNIFPRFHKDKIWSGYVIFGTTYSHQWYPQDILALPSNAITDPVSEWWKLTHETAHAVYRLLEMKERRIPNSLYELVKDGFNGTSVDATHVLQEVFANWFDWRYMFKRDTSFFLESIWKSWLELPVVLQKPLQYLVRTFTLFLANNLEKYHRIYEAESEKMLQNYLMQCWQRFVACISRNVSGFKTLADQLTYKDLLDIFDQATILVSVVYFFDDKLETSCHIEGLSKRLNPAYPNISRHLRSLERGEVITDFIPNPCKLQFELLRRSRRRPISLATQGAFIFSLENHYLRTTQRAR